jgi:hypothetical protein
MHGQQVCNTDTFRKCGKIKCNVHIAQRDDWSQVGRFNALSSLDRPTSDASRPIYISVPKSDGNQSKNIEIVLIIMQRTTNHKKCYQ